MIHHTEIAELSKVQRNVGSIRLFIQSFFPLSDTLHLWDCAVCSDWHWCADLKYSCQAKFNFWLKKTVWGFFYFQPTQTSCALAIVYQASWLLIYLFTHLCVHLLAAITLTMFHWFGKILMTWNSPGHAVGNISWSWHDSEAGYLSDRHINMGEYLCNGQELFFLQTVFPWEYSNLQTAEVQGALLPMNKLSPHIFRYFHLQFLAKPHCSQPSLPMRLLSALCL